MHDPLQMTRNNKEQTVLHLADAMTAPTDNVYETPCLLDGSLEAMNTCLEALAKLTCQDSNEYYVPVLELRFGEIVTTTSLLTIDGCGYLSITAFIPYLNGVVLPSLAHLTTSAAIQGDRNILWHADEGRYVLVRKFPISAFFDERSVLDAIADTSDEAAAWQGLISIDTAGK